jgi:hypothetical protein
LVLHFPEFRFGQKLALLGRVPPGSVTMYPRNK